MESFYTEVITVSCSFINNIINNTLLYAFKVNSKYRQIWLANHIGVIKEPLLTNKIDRCTQQVFPAIQANILQEKVTP